MVSDEFSVELKTSLSANGNGFRDAVCSGNEMAIARVAWIGE